MYYQFTNSFKENEYVLCCTIYKMPDEMNLFNAQNIGGTVSSKDLKGKPTNTLLRL